MRHKENEYTHYEKFCTVHEGLARPIVRHDAEIGQINFSVAVQLRFLRCLENSRERTLVPICRNRKVNKVDLAVVIQVGLPRTFCWRRGRDTFGTDKKTGRLAKGTNLAIHRGL